MLQEVIRSSSPSVGESSALNSDLDFVIARFEEESQIGSNYGRDCANILRDLRVLVQRLKAPLDPILRNSNTGIIGDPSTIVTPETRTMYENGSSWSQGAGPNMIQQQMHVEQGHTLHEELVSWMDGDWQSYGGYMI